MEPAAEHQMVGISLTDRRCGGVEVPSRELPRPPRLITQITSRTQALFSARQLPYHFLVGQAGVPRLSHEVQSTPMVREHELPRRVVSGETRLEAETKLQQRRSSGRRRVRPLELIVCNP